MNVITAMCAYDNLNINWYEPHKRWAKKKIAQQWQRQGGGKSNCW